MATWTLSYNGQIIETNQTGQFTLGPEYPLGTGYTITYQNGSTSETIEYERKTECATCDCSETLVVKNETDYYAYSYPTNGYDLNNVAFAVISSSTKISLSDFVVNKYDEGILDIQIVESGDSRVSEALKTYITTSDKKHTKYNPNIYVIIGTLSTTENKRALKFGYSVCGQECYNLSNPLYVYQRCACGMDNCRNEYGEGGTIIEDRYLKVDSCKYIPEGHSEEQYFFIAADSMCVRTLYVKKVEYYTISQNGTVSPITVIKTFNDEGGKGIKLRDEISGITTAYSQSYNEIKKQLNFEQGMLALDDTGASQTEHTNLYIYLVAVDPTPILPIGSMVQYVVGVKDETSRPDVEQVWRITYHTDSGTIEGGDDNGRCALSDFVVTLYVAPNNKRYISDFDIYFSKPEYGNC